MIKQKEELFLRVETKLKDTVYNLTQPVIEEVRLRGLNANKLSNYLIDSYRNQSLFETMTFLKNKIQQDVYYEVNRKMETVDDDISKAQFIEEIKQLDLHIRSTCSLVCERLVDTEKEIISLTRDKQFDIPSIYLEDTIQMLRQLAIYFYDLSKINLAKLCEKELENIDVELTEIDEFEEQEKNQEKLKAKKFQLEDGIIDKYNDIKDDLNIINPQTKSLISSRVAAIIDINNEENLSGRELENLMLKKTKEVVDIIKVSQVDFYVAKEKNKINATFATKDARKLLSRYIKSYSYSYLENSHFTLYDMLYEQVMEEIR